jgi:putative intracellular protease/amidase
MSLLSRIFGQHSSTPRPSTRTRLGLEALDAREMPAALVSVAAIDSVGSEAGQDPVTFALTRTGGDLSQGLCVNLSWAGSTISCDDVSGGTYWTYFNPGQTVTHITLTPRDDGQVEGNETAVLGVVPQGWYRTDGSVATATVRDNDRNTDSDPLPVLLVIANRDFYYQEYAETRLGLEAGGAEVVVAAGSRSLCTPHWGSGQGADGGYVMPDVAITDAGASDYSAIVFVGGWGASSYQYAFSGTYANAAYNGAAAVELAANELINDFVEQDKYVAAICHGVSVLAWARVDGVSPIAGRTVSAYGLSAPDYFDADGQYNSGGQHDTRWHVESNGAAMVASGSVGDPATAADDVIVDGKVITAENFDSALLFGRTIADHLMR